MPSRTEAGISGESLFLNDRNVRLTRFGVNHIIKEKAGKAVKSTPSLEGRIISTHTFRHTVALHLIQAGVDIMTVKEWLGHADVKTTCLYVAINIEMKRKALQSFPAPERPGETDNKIPNWKKPDVMKFLHNLSRKSA